MTADAQDAAARDFARSVVPLTAEAVTSNLAGTVGRRVSFVCTVQTIVTADAIIGQCGKAIEPVGLYVHLATARLHPGERLGVLGEMETPSQWVDATGHSWFTGIVKATFVRRL